MAEEKIISIKIQTEAEISEIAQLQKQLVQMTKTRNDLNKKIREGLPLSKEEQKQLGQLQPELVATRNKLRDLERQVVKNNDALKKNSGFVAGVKKGMQQAGASFLAFGASLLAVGKVISNAFNIVKDFEQGNANLAAVLGKTSSEITALTEDAKRLGAVTSFSASQVSQLQTEFAKLGFTEKQILNATEATLSLAAATGSDLAGAAAVAGATLGGFGMDAKETQRVVDVMAKSFSTSALDMEKFRESMKLAAPAARAVGMDIEETTALLGTLANAGISGSMAGTALRASFINLGKAGLTLDEGLKKVAESEDKLGTATKLVGKNAATSFLVLAEGVKTTKELEKGLNDAGGAAKKMADEQLNTLQGRITILGSAWEGFILSLDNGKGFLSEFIKGTIELTTTLLGAITKTSSETEKLVESLELENESLSKVNIAANNVNLKSQDRLKLIGQLKSEYPYLLKFVKEDANDNETLFKAIDVVNKSLQTRTLIQKALLPLEEKQGDLIAGRNIQEEFKNDILVEGTSELQKRGKAELLRGKSESEALKIIGDEIFLLSGKTFRYFREQERLSTQEKELNDFRKTTNETITNLIKNKNSLNDLTTDELKNLVLNNVLTDNSLIKKARLLIIERENNKLKQQNITAINEESSSLDENTEATDKNAKSKKKLETELELARKKLGELKSEIDNNAYSGNNNNKVVKEYLDLLVKIAKASKQAKDDISDLSFSYEKLKPIEAGKLEPMTGEDTDMVIDKETQENIKKVKRAKEQQENIEKAKKAAVQEGLNGLSDLTNQYFAAENRKLERAANAEIALLEEKYNKGEINEKAYRKQVDDIREKQFQQEKRNAIIQNTLNSAVAFMKSAAEYGFTPALGVAGAGLGASLIAQNAVVTAQQYEPIEFAEGGLLSGASHAQGGIPFTVAGRNGYEAEGGEAIINKKSTSMFLPLLSAINQAGGGVAFDKPANAKRFALGGLTPNIPTNGTDINGLINAINSRIDNIKVINVATDTAQVANRVNNIQSNATFG